MSDGPLIVQSDRTVLLEVAHPQAEDARHDLAVFAELERAPEHIHTYRITRLGLWNARAAGHQASDMLATLETYSKFPIPQTVAVDIQETVARYGRLVIERDDDGVLVASLQADAFCHSMVRALVGACVAVGEGRLDAADLTLLRDVGARTSAFKVMPAKGLTLMEVGYPHGAELASRAEQTRARRTL